MLDPEKARKLCERGDYAQLARLLGRSGYTLAPPIAYIVQFENWHDNGGYILDTRFYLDDGSQDPTVLEDIRHRYRGLLRSIKRVELHNEEEIPLLP
jgi:hypothetical protein